MFVFCFVLVLARNQAQVTGLAKHPPIQRVAAMFIWFRRELDDTDLQETRGTAGLSVGLYRTPFALWLPTSHL